MFLLNFQVTGCQIMGNQKINVHVQQSKRHDHKKSRKSLKKNLMIDDQKEQLRKKTIASVSRFLCAKHNNKNGTIF